MAMLTHPTTTTQPAPAVAVGLKGSGAYSLDRLVVRALNR